MIACRTSLAHVYRRPRAGTSAAARSAAAPPPGPRSPSGTDGAAAGSRAAASTAPTAARCRRVREQHLVADASRRRAGARTPRAGPNPSESSYREGHGRLVQVDPRAGLLGQEALRDRAGVAELDHELVRPLRGPLAAREPEHAQRRLPERERDGLPALGHALAGAQVERHAGPAPVVDLHLERDERLRLRALRDALLVAVALVLPPDDVRRVEAASSPRRPCSSRRAAPSRRARSGAPWPRSRAPGTGA